MTNNNKFNKEPIILRVIRIILIFVLFPFVLIYLICTAIKRHKRTIQDREKVSVFNISQLDRLSGVEFEGLLKDIFERLGYNVQKTRASHDYGADLVIKKAGQVAVVQAKCYSGTVGIKAVQEIISSKKHYGAKDLIVATNSSFSRDASVLASEYDVKLIDREILKTLIEKTHIKVATEKQKFSATNNENVSEIEKKYPYWI